MRTIIRNGIVVNASGTQQADVLVEDGVIREVASGLRGEGTVVDAAGCYVFPGFIDPHTHFDLDLGFTRTADNFVTASRAALLGGTTTIMDFAEPAKGGTLRAAMEEWNRRAEGSSCNYAYHMELVEWNDALALEMEEMKRFGITSYKMYMVYGMRVDDGEIYRAMKRAKECDALISMHCENYHVLMAKIAEQRAAGSLGPAAHPLSRPEGVEAEAVARFLRIAQMAGAPAYVVHLSTAQGLLEARHARERGQEVYLETCPQYLVLDDSRYLEPDGAKFVMSPPLRTPADQDALWQGLGEGTIDTVGTDHCSFTMEQKALGRDDFTKIPNGGAGVQNRAQLYYTYGVLQSRVTLAQMAAQLSANAARIFGMPDKGAVQPGADADLVVWDPAYTGTVSYKSLAHNCDNSPYEGLAVRGRARDVFLGGVRVVEDGKLIQTGLGKFVRCRTMEHIRA